MAGRCPQRLHQLGLEAITLGARHDQCSVGAPCPSGSLSFLEAITPGARHDQCSVGAPCPKAEAAPIHDGGDCRRVDRNGILRQLLLGQGYPAPQRAKVALQYGGCPGGVTGLYFTV